MPLTKRLVGTNPDGTPRYDFLVENEPEGWNLVATGPAQGLVQLSDGTLYDVSEAVILVASDEHASEVTHHIGVQLERTGVMDVVDPVSGELIKWQHTDCDHCDAPKTAPDDPLSPQAKRQIELHRMAVSAEKVIGQTLSNQPPSTGGSA